MVDVSVIGDSLPAFTAALECAEVGLRVRVLLPAVVDSGDGRAAEPGHETVPYGWPADPVRDVDGYLSSLLERLAAPIAADGPALAAALPQRVMPSTVLMPNASGAWSRVPEPSVFGIPAVPVSADTLAFLPKRAAFRAYLDRVKPLLTLGKTHDLGELVCGRFGEGLRERLVDPLLQDRFGTSTVDAAIAAPGLNEALSRAGSLSAAVLAYSERQEARETRVQPAGGWAALREHVLDRLGNYGVELVQMSALDGPELSELLGADAGGKAVLIVDAGALSTDVQLASFETLAPEHRRAVARVRVTTGGDAFGDRSGAAAPEVAADAAVDAVHTVHLPEGDTWSVRVSREAAGEYVAHLAGPARRSDPQATATSRAAAQAAAERDAYAALSAADLETSDVITVELRAAPWAATAERDQARVLLEVARQAEAGVLPIGSELHGDDLSVAVGDASAAAIALRRRLLGIAD